jgi:hypothetical protein
MFSEPIFPENIWIFTRAILLRWGKGGRLDPRAGELISMRDSNRGRGEDDYPVELFGNHNTAAGKCRGTLATRSRGALPHHPHFHFSIKQTGQIPLDKTNRAESTANSKQGGAGFCFI